MNYACPHCSTNLKRRLVGHRHVNMLRGELICPSCKKPIEVNKSGLEMWLQPLIFLPGIPLFKLWFTDNPPLWAWVVTAALMLLSVLVWWCIWKNHLREWPRYAKIKTF